MLLLPDSIAAALSAPCPEALTRIHQSTDLFCEDHSVHQIQNLLEHCREVCTHGADQPFLSWPRVEQEGSKVTQACSQLPLAISPNK